MVGKRTRDALKAGKAADEAPLNDNKEQKEEKERKSRVARAALALGLAGKKELIPLDDSQRKVEQEEDSESEGEESESDVEDEDQDSAQEDDKHDPTIVEKSVAASKDIKAARKAGSKVAVKKVASIGSKHGVIYLGHIPHGFFEEQMNGFFAQFGSVLRLRLSRSRKTGNSRGYAFIQFESQETANIVQKAMHEYILCGKLLVCELVKPENVHERMFEGARDKQPRRRPDGAKLAASIQRRPRSVKEKKRRALHLSQREGKRVRKLKELGISYELPEGGFKAKVESILGAKGPVVSQREVKKEKKKVQSAAADAGKPKSATVKKAPRKP